MLEKSTKAQEAVGKKNAMRVDIYSKREKPPFSVFLVSLYAGKDSGGAPLRTSSGLTPLPRHP